ncbi:MAG: hypothetical protein M0026_21710 [Nocardiopsaceae bacterium]|nr:hypothetical protein [Nocardiopsaceae bacterium]MDA8372468.1 hypothetical protein [Nocardiopsaceae bacterium]
MKITGYDLIKVTKDHHGHVHVHGATDHGGTAFILLDVEYRHLTFEVLHLIWRAAWAAGHVAIIGLADAQHEVSRYLAERAGQLTDTGPTDADDAAAEAEAYGEILADIARFREETGQ